MTTEAAMISLEVRKRIRLCIYAYAYEMLNESLINDSEYDRLSQEIDLSVNTNRPYLDAWFRNNFDPSTGMWIRSHPELNQIEFLTKKVIAYRKTL